MPIYAYECSACGFKWETLEPMSSPKERTCESPGCDHTARRIMSQMTFKFNCKMPTAPTKEHKHGKE